MRRFIPLFLLLSAGSWMAVRYYRQQNSLYQQLAHLTAVLTIENDRVSKETQNTIKSTEEAAAKNRNQPADIALLHRAEALQESVNKLLVALRNYSGQLRYVTSGFNALAWLQQLHLASSGQAPNQGTLRQQALQEQVAAYADTLRRLGLAQADNKVFTTPNFNEAISMPEALADLSQLESEVLARQTFALQRIAKSVGARRWLTHPLLTATAESNIVVPSATYRAQLGLVGYFLAAELRMQMACNGRPVPVGPNGTGLVRFRAPTRPGPATWTGTIRLNQNGRDTTFRVTVPYRVARR